MFSLSNWISYCLLIMITVNFSSLSSFSKTWVGCGDFDTALSLSSSKPLSTKEWTENWVNFDLSYYDYSHKEGNSRWAGGQGLYVYPESPFAAWSGSERRLR